MGINVPVFANAAEVERMGTALERPGWTIFYGYDANPGEDAHQLSAHDIQACQVCAEENCFGGFCVWDGTAYLRETPGVELKENLQRCLPPYDAAEFYLYIPPSLPAAGFAQVPSRPPQNAGGELDEDEISLQEAL